MAQLQLGDNERLTMINTKMITMIPFIVDSFILQNLSKIYKVNGDFFLC